MKDLKIINGKFPDFENDSWVQADIVIHDGVIEFIGDVPVECENVIDAAGKVVAPGFIDIHAHEDQFVGRHEDDFFTAGRGLLMGVTTQIVGNCGDNYNAIEDFVSNIEHEGAPLNMMTFVGQNFLRELAGATDRYQASTPQQLDRMKKMLSHLRKFEPVGISCGFEYAPGVTSEETIELAKALEEEGYLISVHFREDGPMAPQSTRELVEISKATGYAMEMSHIGSCAAVGYMADTLKIIKEAREAGVDISSDCYPYNAFCTGIGTAVFDEGCFERWGKSYSDVLVLSGPYLNQRCTRELFEKLRDEDPDLHVAVFAMNEEEVDMAYQAPFVMVGSDCGFVSRHGHPRGAGAFPRVIRQYVREKKQLTLIEALRKMTIMPADRVGLSSKGEIKEGMDADIVIFDENLITDRATFEEPTLAAGGIDYVIVGGHIAADHGRIVCDNAGRYIGYNNRG